MPDWIVAEVTKNWPGPHYGPLPGHRDTVSGRFERVINHNRQMGYELDSWRMSAVVVGDALTETIVAVFRRRPHQPTGGATDGRDAPGVGEGRRSERDPAPGGPGQFGDADR